MKFIIIIFLITILIQYLFKNYEYYDDFKRKRAHNKKIQLGFLRDTPPELKSITTDLQKIGGQLHEDTRYDHVATDYLDPNNIN